MCPNVNLPKVTVILVFLVNTWLIKESELYNWFQQKTTHTLNLRGLVVYKEFCLQYRRKIRGRTDQTPVPFSHTVSYEERTHPPNTMRDRNGR